jgi:lipoyl(octanoyl) transferase
MSGLLIQNLGTMRYRDAWAVQEAAHAEVLAGGPERLLLVEHPPVITLGRRGETEGPKHLLASSDSLHQLGVELVQSDRGGDITFHGPGQIVAYPIVKLIDHGLSVGGYVRRLEATVIAALEEMGVAAQRIDGCVGIWTAPSMDSAKVLPPAKICAIGVRIRRGVSMHGIALNVYTDLRYFNLIVPCGLADKRVTSIAELLGERAPDMDSCRKILTSHFQRAFPL